MTIIYHVVMGWLICIEIFLLMWIGHGPTTEGGETSPSVFTCQLCDGEAPPRHIYCRECYRRLFGVAPIEHE